MQHLCLSSIAMIIFVLLYDFIKHKTNHKSFDYIAESNRIIILFICIIPVLWSVITFNHFYNHIIYTYRNIMLLYTYILLLFFTKEKRKL